MSKRSRNGRIRLGLAAGIGAGLLGRTMWSRRRTADLRGQIALVTGGSRGLGYLLAREFAREGCPLAICARDAAELERARADLESQGAQVLAVPCDVSDRAEVDRLVETVKQHYGRIDVLVNNAGIIQVGPVGAMTDEDFEAAMGVMFWGTVYPTLAVLPDMRARHSGRIVNVTSIGGKVSVPQLLPYSCAKFAAVGFSEGLRAEVARDSVQVTTIAPGLMRTGSHLNAWFKGEQERAFALFAPLSSLPFISIDAEQAAREIVAATRNGEAERILTMPANVLARAHGLFPGLTSDVLGLINRVLPATNGHGNAAVRGMDVEQRIDSPLLKKLTSWSRSAAQRFHEYPGPVDLPADGEPVAATASTNGGGGAAPRASVLHPG